MSSHITDRKSENRRNLKNDLKSSPEARRLGRAAVEKYGSLRAAARALKIPTHGQLGKMINGTLRDTPAMKAAIKRADRRARRAWLLVRDESPDPHIDVDALRGAISVVERQLKMMRELMKKVATGDHIDTDPTHHPNCRCVLTPDVLAIDPQPAVTDEYVRTVMARQQAPGAFEPGGSMSEQ